MTAAELAAIDAGPFFVHTPFVILQDKAEKTPWTFTGIVARSFVDKEQRTYLPRVDPRYLGIGRGDYSLEGMQDRIAIERKSMADFQGTLLGWERIFDEDHLDQWDTRNSVDRRKRFKNELGKLSAMQTGWVIVEATFGAIVENAPSWGVRTSVENAKYLAATTLAWMQEFPRVRWMFCDDRRMAEVMALRIMEKFWAEQQRRGRTKKNKPSLPHKDLQIQKGFSC